MIEIICIIAIISSAFMGLATGMLLSNMKNHEYINDILKENQELENILDGYREAYKNGQL